ncbi:MAG: imidazole glycerol phosphate synthase subunit HisH [Chitinophagaceae bacterium]|nr:imidazole glycerol phosphate synthase subunit HisH [Chitinophagaceae bacterium]
MTTILDYGMGNVGSVRNMIKRMNFDCIISSSRADIEASDKLIIPGVGSFDSAVVKLQDLGMYEIIQKKAQDPGAYILGICLGMQLLFNNSEEGVLPGLGLINGAVRKFNEKEINRRIPHIGWNYVKEDPRSRLFAGCEEAQRFYFVHSYYATTEDPDCIKCVSNYGIDFVSAVEKNNVLGVQFHPEKSHRYGKALLKNFLEL